MTKIETSPKYGATITLEPNARYPFRFGPDKARMILANLDDIRSFAEAHPPKVKQAPPSQLEQENARLARELELLRAQVNGSNGHAAPSAPADIINHIRR